MTTVRRVEIVPFSARQMYDLVNDVPSYPRFLAWCHHAEVSPARDNRLRARLEVAKGKLRYSFTTENTLTPGARIEMQLADGPFRHLHGAWCFEEVPGGCRVSLDLEFEFANRLATLALGQVFKPIANSLVEAFRTRAFEVYGA